MLAGTVSACLPHIVLSFSQRTGLYAYSPAGKWYDLKKECYTMKKVLVAYFSASGETAKLARTISAVTSGDLFEIEPEQHYTATDLIWTDKKSRSTIG